MSVEDIQALDDDDKEITGTMMLPPQHTCQYGGSDVCVECLLEQDEALNETDQ